jgi:hypothetical protein
MLQPAKKCPVFRIPKVYYRVHINPPIFRTPNQINTVHIVSPLCLKSVLVLSVHLQLGLTNELLPRNFLIKLLCAFLTSPRMLQPRPSHPPSFDHPDNI